VLDMVHFSRQHRVFHRPRTQKLQRRSAALSLDQLCASRMTRKFGDRQQEVLDENLCTQRSLRCRALLEPARLHGREPGEADHRPSLVVLSRRISAGLLSHREAGPDSTCYRYHVTDTDMLEMQEVKFAPPASASEKQSPRLQRYSTTATSKPCSATSLRSSSSWPRFHSRSAGRALRLQPQGHEAARKEDNSRSLPWCSFVSFVVKP